MRFKKGDRIVVISGSDKGKAGIVRETNSKNNTLIAEGINIKTIHVKPTQQNPKGGILKMEKPIDASNVMLNVGGKKISLTKTGYRIEKNKKGQNKKVRYSKKTGEEV